MNEAGKEMARKGGVRGVTLSLPRGGVKVDLWERKKRSRRTRFRASSISYIDFRLKGGAKKKVEGKGRGKGVLGLDRAVKKTERKAGTMRGIWVRRLLAIEVEKPGKESRIRRKRGVRWRKKRRRSRAVRARVLKGDNRATMQKNSRKGK